MSTSILSNTYGGSLFNTPAAAARASLTDYLLAGGLNTTDEALAFWRDHKSWSDALDADAELVRWVSCDDEDADDAVKQDVASYYEGAWGNVGEAIAWELVDEHGLRDEAIAWVIVGDLQDLYIDGDEEDGEDAISQMMAEADDRTGTRDDYTTRTATAQELVDLLLGDDDWMRERTQVFLDKLAAE